MSIVYILNELVRKEHFNAFSVGGWREAEHSYGAWRREVSKASTSASTKKKSSCVPTRTERARRRAAWSSTSGASSWEERPQSS